MQTTINKKDFINALTIGGAMAGKAKTLPILEYAKVEVEGDHLACHSFNGESWVTKRVKIESADTNFAFCINASELGKALKSLAEEVVSFSIEGTILTINHFKGTMEMPILQDSNFPIHQATEDGINVSISVDILKEWISISSNFVAQDDMRPIMCGMYLYARDGVLGVCATDAHKLFTDHIEYSCDTNFGVILPASGFKPLLSMLNGVDEVGVTIGDKNISFSTEDSELHCRLIEGVYPNFNAVIPRNNSVEVKASKSELLDSVQRTSLMANKSTSLLKLSVEDSSMGIEGSDVDFSTKAYETIAVEKTGGDVTIGIKAEYCATCLNIIKSEELVLKLDCDNKPILFLDTNTLNKVILVMPMKF